MESGMQDETDAQQPEPVGAAKWTAKHDATTRAATEIIERERIEREAKTARLRAARLARETCDTRSAVAG